MPRAICTKCNISLRPETNGVAVAEMYKDDREIYKIWDADLWKCPGCGVKIILGFADNPLAEHFSDKFDVALAYLREKLKRGQAYVWNERFHPPGEKPPGL